MPCPDLPALGRVGTPQADPEVLAHLWTCRSCWLDWQIQQGARYLLNPEINATDDQDERVISRAMLITRHAERPAGWRNLTVFGLLVAMAVFVILSVPVGTVGAIPAAHAAVFALAGGVGAALYFKRRDEQKWADFTKRDR